LTEQAFSLSGWEPPCSIFTERTLQGSDLSILITVSIIMVISFCTQLLLNDINRNKRALQELNETLEQKVKERTEELRSSELKYRTIFETPGRPRSSSKRTCVYPWPIPSS
jgi:C4-dicarboxylate-specific signal transduction histidine kinase